MQCFNGHTMQPGAAFCSTCGARAATAPAPAIPQPPAPIPNAYAPNTYPVAPATYTPVAMATPVTAKRTMYTAAAVINWVVLGLIVLGTAGIGLICALWFVPMTILIHKGAKGPYKHTALGVCTLLFCNLISGILMLVDDSNRPAPSGY